MNKILITILVLVSLIYSNEIQSKEVIIAFEGHITSVNNNTFNPLNGDVKVGTNFTGTYTYDTDLVDLDPSDTLAVYHDFKKQNGFTLNIAGYNVDSNTATLQLDYRIQSDPTLSHQYIQTFGFDYQGNNAWINISLTDHTGTALTNTDLKDTAPRLSDYYKNSFLFIIYNNTGCCIGETDSAYWGTITKAYVVPSIPKSDINSNLVAHWSFDESSGTVATDSSANGNNGMLTNGPLWNAGKISGAIDLDGVDDYVDVASDASLDDIDIKTITAWIKRKDIASSQFIALKGYTGGPGGWEFYVRRSTGGASGNRIGYNHQWSGSRWRTAMWYGSTDLDTADQWYHVAIVYDATSATNIPKIYLNGIQETITVVNAASGNEAVDAANNLTIGGVAGESANAMMDDVRIYRRALASSEIKQIYNLSTLIFQCSDTIDNDGDGLIDYPSDPKCKLPTDTDEFNGPLDVTPPTIPMNLQATAISPSQIDLTWNASTDDNGWVGYNIYRDGIQIFATSVSITHSDSSLTPATTYNYTVSAYDRDFNVSVLSVGVNVTTMSVPQCSDSLDNDSDGLIDFPNDPGCSSATDDDEYNAPVDTTPPTIPTNVQATVISPTQIDLTWNASTDASGNVIYYIYRDGIRIPYFTNSTNYSDSSLTPATAYRYSVSAHDGVPNESAQSVAVTATTLTAPQCNDSVDNDGDGLIDFPSDPGCSSATDDDEYNAPVDTPPSIPTNLQATLIHPTRIDLTWNASTDDTGVTGYSVFRDGLRIYFTSSNFFSDSALTPDTTVSYTVSAHDDILNESAPSAAVTVTTPPAPQCSDSVDNDGDGLIDFPNDPGCSSATDDDEYNAPVVDTTPPSKPTNLQAVTVSSTQIDLTWTASTDNVGVIGYYIYATSATQGYSGSTTSTSFSFGGLVHSTAYDFRVVAYDAKDNRSPQSDVASASTQTIFAPNLIGHWTFDHGIGTFTADSSGSGNNGSMINGAHSNNGALDLDGVDDYVDLYSDASLDDIGIKTISAWIQRKDISSSQLIALKGYTGGPGGWEFNVRRSTGGASANRVGYNHQWSGSRWRTAMWYGSTDLDTVGLWYHVVLIYDASSAINIPVMYVNGIQETVTVVNAAAGTEAVDAFNKLTIGGVPGESSNAMIDDVRIYDKAMTTTEVQQLYNLGRPVP